MNISLLQKSCVKALCKQLNHTSITQMTRLLKNAFSFITSKGSLDAALPDGKHIFSAIQVMKILTLVLTNSLGNYHWSYLNEMDDEGRAFVQKLVLYFKYTYVATKSVHILKLCTCSLFLFLINVSNSPKQVQNSNIQHVLTNCLCVLKRQ